MNCTETTESTCNGGSDGYVPSEHSRSDRCPVSLWDDNLDGDGNHDHTNGGNNGNNGNGGNGGNGGNDQMEWWWNTWMPWWIKRTRTKKTE